jgi:hypothetical protein
MVFLRTNFPDLELSWGRASVWPACLVIVHTACPRSYSLIAVIHIRNRCSVNMVFCAGSRWWDLRAGARVENEGVYRARADWYFDLDFSDKWACERWLSYVNWSWRREDKVQVVMELSCVINGCWVLLADFGPRSYTVIERFAAHIFM